MTKKIITESELAGKVSALRMKMAALEGVQSEDANTAGNVAGQGLKTAVNTMTAPVRGAWDVAKGAWDATKNFAKGAVQGYTGGGIDPLHPVDSAKQAVASYKQSGNTPQSTPATGQATKPATKAAPKSDPAVLKLQQDLIAKGAKIKADGIMGPATKAAQAQFGDAQAGQATKPAEPAAAPAPAAPAAPAPAAAPAPTAPSPYAGSPEQEKVWNTLTQADKDWLTKGGGRPNLLDPIILSRAPNGGKPAPAAAPAAAPAPAPAAAPAELTPQQQAQNVLQPGMNKVQEGGYSELQRIMSIVQHR